MPAGVLLMFADALPLDVSSREPISLGEVILEVPQMVRVDRKYLVPVRTAQTLVDLLPTTFRVLTIDGRTSTRYRSTYFDTEDLTSARAHLQQRRRRWKARSRLYVEDDLCRLEVKARDGRGVTAKTVAHADRYGILDDVGIEFITSALGVQGLTADVLLLRPTMEVAYRRTTLADTGEDPARLTLDWRVLCTLGDERVWLDRGYVVIETKGGLRPGTGDRMLLEMGVR